ncbi:MAG: hypothetical protein ACLP5E_04550 [Streptosporangiaceae bacterium]
MSEVYLHAGPVKTGSTSVVPYHQLSLAGNALPDSGEWRTADGAMLRL